MRKKKDMAVGRYEDAVRVVFFFIKKENQIKFKLLKVLKWV